MFHISREEYPCLGWVCLGNGVVTLCMEQKVPQENAINEDKLTWYLGTSQLVSCNVLVCGSRKCPGTFCTSWTSCVTYPFSSCITWEGFFWLVKVVVSNQSPPTSSQDVPGCPSHPFIPSFLQCVQAAPWRPPGRAHRHSVVSIIKPKRCCLALELSGQPLYAETEELIR